MTLGLGANRSFADCHEGEVLHLRQSIETPDGELIPGYYVLREVLSFSDQGGISFGVVSQVGEDADGALVTDGQAHILPPHLLELFVGTGLKAREPFIRQGKTNG